MTESKEITWKEFILLTNISNTRDTSRKPKSEWAKVINTQSTNPMFTRCLKILKENNISHEEPWIGNYILVAIDIKKLDKFLESTTVYKIFEKFVYTKEKFVIGV